MQIKAKIIHESTMNEPNSQNTPWPNLGSTNSSPIIYHMTNSRGYFKVAHNLETCGKDS
jgi:hypothetical protein